MFQVYRNLNRAAWSIRHRGRVIEHRPTAALVNPETERKADET